MIRSKKLRESARNQDCTVMIPKVCNHNPETTVLAHLGGGGMGMKVDDFKAAICCSDCHDALDGRRQTEHTKQGLLLWHHQGILRTWDIWVRDGLIKIGDAK